MTIGSDLVATCRDAGVSLTLDGGQLRYRAPDTPEAREALRLVARLRDEVVHSLEGPSTATPWQRFVALVELDRAERRAGR
jgi:hypothetical protein